MLGFIIVLLCTPFRYPWESHRNTRVRPGSEFASPDQINFTIFRFFSSTSFCTRVSCILPEKQPRFNSCCC